MDNIDLFNAKQLAYYRTLKAQLKARENKKTSVINRQNWLLSQKMHNRQMERDRLQNELNSGLLKGLDTNVHKKRLQHLDSLGTKAVSGLGD